MAKVSKRITVKTVKGEELTILIERDGEAASRTFPVVAVLNGWDADCKYSHGKTASDAVEELLLQLDQETDEDLRYLNAFFAGSPPRQPAR